MHTLVTAAAVAVLGALAQAQAADCFRYGSTMTLAGQLAVNMAPDGNSAGRRADILTLDVPICIAADAISAGIPHVASLQALCPEADLIDGASVSITGRLVGAHTGNGHPPVLLVCRP